MNIVTAFARAAANLPLTPQERAWLKLVEGLLTTGFVAAVGVIGMLVTSGHFTVNTATLDMVIGAAFSAMVASGKKLISAQGDVFGANVPTQHVDAPTGPDPASAGATPVDASAA